MKINPVQNPISFKYKSVLKSEWLKGNMPTVVKGIYGGKLKPYNVTLEHIKPHSKGGKTALNNLALAVDFNNWGRSNKPFKSVFSRIVFDEYCDQFKGIKLPNFDGDEYVKNLYKTVERELNK